MSAKKLQGRVWHGFVNRFEAYQGKGFGGLALQRFAKPFYVCSANDFLAPASKEYSGSLQEKLRDSKNGEFISRFEAP